MSTLLLIFITALVFAIGVTPVMRALAIRVGIVDQPGARKIHTSPVPLLGGVAVYIAFIIALILFVERSYIAQTIGILLGATFVSFLGIWDDRVRLRVRYKLGGQIFATIILIATGVTVNLFQNPLIDWTITLMWVVGITNAMNLLDNMDGLSGGIAAIAAAFFVLLSALNGQYLVGSLSAALLGASIGFLRYNFTSPSIFMGDAVCFVGFVLAALGIKLRFPGHPLEYTWFIPLLVLGLPIFDTTLVFISRIRRRLNPLTTPGKDHISHRLVERGMTKREAVMTLYLVAGILGVLAMFCAQLSALENYLLVATVLVVGILALWEFDLKSVFKS